MSFLSIDFLILVLITWCLHQVIPAEKITTRNILLLFSSYLFYYTFGVKFLLLLIISTFLNYLSSRYLNKIKSVVRRRLLLTLIIVFNLILLFYYKLFGSLIDESVMIPVGISFFTFQALGYVLDVYKGENGGEISLLSFSLYMAFFPQLVAGPIEKANSLIPYFEQPRFFDKNKFSNGLRLLILGMFYKLVIADNFGVWTNNIFSNVDYYHGGVLLLGPFFYGVQIYADFCGYSLIALGLANLFGVELSWNFKFPFFSSSPKEFWNRWHITLKNWFVDYVYLPLGGSKVGKLKFIRNVLLIFCLSGVWHGIGWNFLIWGFLNGLIFVLFSFFESSRSKILNFVSWCFTFLSIGLLWTFFRLDELNESLNYFKNIWGKLFSRFSFIEMCAYLYWQVPITFYFGFAFILFFEVYGYRLGNSLLVFERLSSVTLRWITYFAMIFLIFVLQLNDLGLPFIYFQF